jgi:hypothetical protein
VGPAHQQPSGFKSAKRLAKRATGKIETGAEFDFADLFARGKVALNDGRLQTIEGFIGTGIGLGDSFRHILSTIVTGITGNLRPNSIIVNNPELSGSLIVDIKAAFAAQRQA